MPSEHRHIGRNRAQHLRYQQAHPAVADDGHTRLRIDGHLLEDPARGRDRLGKHGRLVVHGFRNRVQVDRRQRQVFGERAIVLADAHDVAVGAMLLDSARAPVAVPTPDVDFANDAPAHPGTVRSRRLFNDANELVPRDPGELGVAFEQLKICPADAGLEHADQALAGVLGPWLFPELDDSRPGDDECFHSGVDEEDITRPQ